MKTKIFKGLLFASTCALLLSGCGGNNEERKPTCTHVFDDWEIDVEPSYEATGVAKRICSECEEVEEVILPILTDSKYTLGRNTATCTDQGTLSVSYPIGNETFEFRVIAPPKGHSYVSHEATVLSPDTLIGHDAYFTCENCETLFNKEKEVISSLDDIMISYYNFDEESHWTDEEPTHIPHTFGEEVIDKTATYFEKGSKHKECSVCGYIVKEDIPMMTIGTVASDGFYESKNYKEGLNLTGANKICDGIYIFGSEQKGISTDINDNIVFGGQANKDARIILFDIAGPTEITIKGGSTKANTLTTFGFFDGIPNEDADNFLGEPKSTDSTSNGDYKFKLETAGRYWFGCTDGCKIKIKAITVEIHEIVMDEWHYDETQHFHSSNNPECETRLDAENHTFGEWESYDEIQDVKTCSVCNYKLYEDKEEHSGCEHNYVAGPSETAGKIKYTCSKCTDSYEKNFVRYVPDSEEKTKNMKIAVGNNLVDEEGEITALEVYASQGSGSFTVSSMESHEFTMADTSKVSLSDTLTIGGNNYESCVLKMKIPSACKVRIYAYTDSDPNFRLWQKSTTKDVYTTITDVKAAGFHVMEFEATKEDVYNVGCSNKVDMLTYFAVEFIY